MSVDMADTLARRYLAGIKRQSDGVHTLMDFFQDDRAKRALHNPQLDMKQICMNYHTVKRTAKIKSVTEGLANLRSH